MLFCTISGVSGDLLSDEPLSIFPSERLSLLETLYSYPIMLLICCHLISLNVLCWFCPSWLFLNVLLASNSNRFFFLKRTKFLNFDIYYVLWDVRFPTNYKSEIIRKIIFNYILHSVSTFWPMEVVKSLLWSWWFHILSRQHLLL